MRHPLREREVSSGRPPIRRWFKISFVTGNCAGRTAERDRVVNRFFLFGAQVRFRAGSIQSALQCTRNFAPAQWPARITDQTFDAAGGTIHSRRPFTKHWRLTGLLVSENATTVPSGRVFAPTPRNLRAQTTLSRGPDLRRRRVEPVVLCFSA